MGLVALGDRGGHPQPSWVCWPCGCPLPPPSSSCCSSTAASPIAHGMVLVSAASHRVPPAHGSPRALAAAPPRSGRPLRTPEGRGGGVVGKAEPQAGSILNKAQCFWGSDCAEMSPPPPRRRQVVLQEGFPFPQLRGGRAGG